MSLFENLEARRPARDEKAYFFDSDLFAKSYPYLHDLLAVPEAFGKPREPGSVKVFANEGKLKAMLVDPTTNSVAFVTLNPELHLWTQLEALLAKGGADWREGKKWGKKSMSF